MAYNKITKIITKKVIKIMKNKNYMQNYMKIKI